jgi:uncharacterized membrane protein
MRSDNRIILAAIVILTLALIPLALFTSGPVRVMVSFLCLLFFPGYALLSALFPGQGEIGTIERIALSFGVSIAILPIIGLVLNFTPWGIKLMPALVSVTAFTVMAAIVGFIREQALPVERRFHISKASHLEGWQSMRRAKKVMWIAVLLAALGGAGSLIYFEVSLPVKPAPTEFYILNAEGKAENYPRQVKAGDMVSITAVVINHESQTTAYAIRAVTDGNVVGETSTPALATEAKWEGKLDFSVAKAGTGQKIEFYLYKGGEVQPYFEDPLYIYIDAVE